jgi:hypothetical protein
MELETAAHARAGTIASLVCPLCGLQTPQSNASTVLTLLSGPLTPQSITNDSLTTPQTTPNTTGQALTSVIGALIEIPTMLSLVKTAEMFRRRLYNGTLDKKVRGAFFWVGGSVGGWLSGWSTNESLPQLTPASCQPHTHNNNNNNNNDNSRRSC